MDAQEAYEKIIKSNPGCYGTEAIDFDSFFVFCLRPLSLDESTDYFTGSVFDAVDKNTGRTYKYDIFDDPDKFLEAPRVSIKNVYKKTLKELEVS